MMNIPIALAAQVEGPNVFSQAGIVSLMGMLTIFVVLALLWAAVEIMHRVLHRGEKKEKPVPEKKPAPVGTDDAAIAAAIAAAMAASEDDGATVAAITAAITAMRAEAGDTGAFRVVSFKAVGRANRHRRF
jgi:sodium pump decarboxylase gamma subunit